MSTGKDVDLSLTPFEPDLHVSPFRLFRWLHEAQEGRAEPPVLLELHNHRDPPRGRPLRLRDARPFTDAALPDREKDRDVVLVDRNGREATARARRLRAAGHRRVRALYGGLVLYDFALDPAVVGAERFLAG